MWGGSGEAGRGLHPLASSRLRRWAPPAWAPVEVSPVLGLTPLTLAAASATSYLSANRLGSELALSSASGTVQRMGTYEPSAPYSRLARSTLAPRPPHGLHGQYRDQSGLYYMRARQHYPASGRFLTVDAIASAMADPHTGSYVYAENAPTLLVDPLGLASQSPGVGCQYNSANPASWAGLLRLH